MQNVRGMVVAALLKMGCNSTPQSRYNQTPWFNCCNWFSQGYMLKHATCRGFGGMPPKESFQITCSEIISQIVLLLLITLQYSFHFYKPMPTITIGSMAKELVRNSNGQKIFSLLITLCCLLFTYVYCSCITLLLLLLLLLWPRNWPHLDG